MRSKSINPPPHFHTPYIILQPLLCVVTHGCFVTYRMMHADLKNMAHPFFPPPLHVLITTPLSVTHYNVQRPALNVIYRHDSS